MTRLEELVGAGWKSTPVVPRPALGAEDVVLIAYPDQVRDPAERPLGALRIFAEEYLSQLINTIHVLPFFPSSSDDGFSVTNYLAVDSAYGEWADLVRLGQKFGLMYDAVINHASVQGDWFQGYLRKDPRFSDFFIEVDGEADIQSVVRPRTTPLLTKFGTQHGSKLVWTTFGADQADLNYRNPEVLLCVLDILLHYVERGARFLRLDAVGYIWKELGTSCIHRPQAHAIVRLIRAVMNAVAPSVGILTETNVSQGENLRYLGNGAWEADLAYNFALPPLLLHAFYTKQTTILQDWAAALPDLPPGKALLNVLATHDGVGLNGCREFLSDVEIDWLVHRVEAAGGYISRRATSSGGSDPYELNVNYLDALGGSADSVSEDVLVRMFTTAHAIMFALKGVPALYFHSLVGSRGWDQGVLQSGRPRSVNREKLLLEQLRSQLADRRSLRSRVFTALSSLLRARRNNPAFSPFADQTVLKTGNGLFAFLRRDNGQSAPVLCLHNVTPERQEFDLSAVGSRRTSGRLRDIISSREVETSGSSMLELEPYQALWLRISQDEEGEAN